MDFRHAEMMLEKFGTPGELLRDNKLIGTFSSTLEHGDLEFIMHDKSIIAKENDIIRLDGNDFVVLSNARLATSNVFNAQVKTKTELEHNKTSNQSFSFGDVAGSVVAGNQNIADFSVNNVSITEVIPEITSSSDLSADQQLELIELMTTFSSEKNVTSGRFEKFADWIEKHPASLQFIGQIATGVLLGK